MSKSIENPSSAVPKIELPSLEPETLEELRELLREHIAPLVPDFAHLSINQQRAGVISFGNYESLILLQVLSNGLMMYCTVGTFPY